MPKPRHNLHCAKTKGSAARCTCYDSFDQFLQGEFQSSGFADGVYKDSLEDAYEAWVCELGAGDLVEYGDAYGSYLRNLIENGIPYGVL